MSKSMTWTQVKKELKNHSTTDLLDLIKELHAANDLNKVFLSTRLNLGTTMGSKELESIKKKLKKALLPSPKRYFDYEEFAPDPKYTMAHKLIKDYEKTKDDLGILDLYLSYAEGATAYLIKYDYMPSRFIDSACGFLAKFEAVYQNNPMYYARYFKKRLEDLNEAPIFQSLPYFGECFQGYFVDLLDLTPPKVLDDFDREELACV
ncbi:MAG: hypothetical protein ACK5T0_08915 [Vampirovibrionales bacterium]|jgi:hypothetical protein